MRGEQVLPAGSFPLSMSLLSPRLDVPCRFMPAPDDPVTSERKDCRRSLPGDGVASNLSPPRDGGPDSVDVIDTHERGLGCCCVNCSGAPPLLGLLGYSAVSFAISPEGSVVLLVVVVPDSLLLLWPRAGASTDMSTSAGLWKLPSGVTSEEVDQFTGVLLWPAEL